MTEIYKVDQTARKFLFEGVQGENESRSIRFDITPWTTELGNGAVTATAKRPTDAAPYPVTVTRDGNTVTWKPTSTDTAFDGIGSFQLEYTVDSVLAKTCIWSTMVAPSLDPAGDPPDPYDNWLAEMRQIAADALQDAQDADASAQDAEAWTKGTKNGTPVPSTADQYENNAKYWAGQAEDLKDATQAIVDEARTDVFEAMDGLHEETTAGSALQLISDKYTENKEPYLFRKSGGGKSIGNREIDTLVGGSILWNQLVCNGNFASTTRWGGRYAEVTVSNNIATVTPTSSGTDRGLIGSNSSAPLAVYGHKYLLAVDVFSPITSYCSPSFGGGNVTADRRPVTANTWTRVCNVWTMPSNVGYRQNLYALIAGTVTTEQEIKYKNAIGVDLTQMFGTTIADYIYSLEQANAGAGVALFRSWFPKEYYAYNEGTLMSVKTSAHEMVGFNQWDEEWTAYSPTQIQAKTPIPVFSGTNYYVKAPAALALYYLDENKSVISAAYPYNVVITTPNNCRYINFITTAGYSSNVYKNDICISISSDRNGEYEPYTKHTYALDDVELRGVMKLDGMDIYFDGDTYEADGTVTRRYHEISNAGSFDFSKNAEGQFFSPLSVRSVAFTTNIMCSKYVASARGAYDGQVDKAISMSGGYLWIRDSSYNTGDELEAALQGVHIVYELETPTTETADPFTSPQIVDAYGTERYVDERTVAVPVGHVTKYPDNLREKLDGLPWDFSNLIAPTEKAYTATRNYTTGSLFIVGNILYKATANIANGGTITPNTNCTATTLAEVISAL